jgi:phosphopantetheinyl transferase (holo-ACP synthase)
MFHGPAFQGVAELGPIGHNGIDGGIEAGEAPGALLDCAGQLVGYWVMATTEVDRLAMPVGVERIEYYGPTPLPGTRVACRVRVRHLDETVVRSDMELVYSGLLWARILGWENRRLETDERLWPVLRHPEKHLLSLINGEGGYSYFHDRYRSAPSRDFLARRFLCEAERDIYVKLAPSRHRQWLSGRVAAKDAVRACLWSQGWGPLFPAEVAVLSDHAGRPVLRGPFPESLQVSIAHCDDVAVALAAEGRSPGIDIERIEPRPGAFEAAAFTARERGMIAGEARDEWVTRCFSAKEAVAKARGEGLGNPRRFQISDVDGEQLMVDGTPVETRRDGDYIVSWTPL